ncbi:MAG: hypothetical protein EXR79_11810 [Myxococcales bacterium]|nr:hypothetical protein [Myxococcales bacterium]
MARTAATPLPPSKPSTAAPLQPGPSGAAGTTQQSRWLAVCAHVVRPHILAIACGAALTFGWLMSGLYLWLAVVFCALDWFVVNLMNRVADLAEDRANGILGTEWLARNGRRVEVACALLATASLAAGHALCPALTPVRVAFTLIGWAYNYRVLPGRRRFKEIYAAKNGMSGVLFVLSTIAYPAVVGPVAVDVRWLVALVAFFFPLEITYEIIYDLRDVAGDRALAVPTFPAVHGEAAAAMLVWVLLAASAGALAIGGALGVLRFRDVVLIGGPLQQAVLFRWLILRRGATPGRAMALTWLGAAQIASYHAWIGLGLPLDGPS